MLIGGHEDIMAYQEDFFCAKVLRFRQAWFGQFEVQGRPSGKLSSSDTRIFRTLKIREAIHLTNLRDKLSLCERHILFDFQKVQF